MTIHERLRLLLRLVSDYAPFAVLALVALAVLVLAVLVVNE